MKAPCTIEGCTNPINAHQMCATHEWRAKRGMPLVGDLFWWRFDQNYDPTVEGCWEWRGTIVAHGYGLYSKQYVHRLSYERFVGPIPDGLQIDHLCRNRACMNPAHLEAVTPRVNVLRSESPSALNARATKCKWGHDFTEENTYIRPDGGGRQCRTCTRDRQRVAS